MHNTDSARPTPPLRRRSRKPAILMASGAVFVVAAVVWSLFAVPALVKYPTDLDVAVQYDGTFLVFADPTTFAPLATPAEAPLTIERHLEAIASQSGSSRVVVRETIAQRAGDFVDATQVNIYVMDRRTMQNVDDARVYAFTPDNPVDRSGAYRLQLPFDTDDRGTYRMYKNELATTYTLTGTGETDEVNGLTLRLFSVDAAPLPLDGAYLAELGKAVALPDSLTLDQLKPQLALMGVDVDGLVAALLPALTAEDTKTLLDFAARPIPLTYTLSFTGSMGVETDTGSEVKLYGATEQLGVRPVLADLDALQGLLDRYPQVPEATAASAALADVATAAPIPVVEYRYAQTPASVADIAGDVKSQREQILLAEQWVPIGLAGAGLILFAIGLYLRPRRGGPNVVLTPLDSGIEHERITPTAV